MLTRGSLNPILSAWHLDWHKQSHSKNIGTVKMKNWNSQWGRSLEKLKVFDLGSNLMELHQCFPTIDIPWLKIITRRLLLLLSLFSHVRLCETPQMAAHQALPSLGFSRQEHWSGFPFPSPMHESEKWKWTRSVVSDSSRPHGLQPTRLLHPWDFPGKSTGVGCHCLLRQEDYHHLNCYYVASACEIYSR